jgi:hypothetical protein
VKTALIVIALVLAGCGDDYFMSVRGAPIEVVVLFAHENVADTSYDRMCEIVWREGATRVRNGNSLEIVLDYPQTVRTEYDVVIVGVRSTVVREYSIHSDTVLTP